MHMVCFEVILSSRNIIIIIFVDDKQISNRNRSQTIRHYGGYRIGKQTT